MAVKVYKPTSPGRRDMSVSAFEEITHTKPEKSLVTGLRKRGAQLPRQGYCSPSWWWAQTSVP